MYILKSKKNFENTNVYVIPPCPVTFIYPLKISENRINIRKGIFSEGSERVHWEQMGYEI